MLRVLGLLAVVVLLPACAGLMPAPPPPPPPPPPPAPEFIVPAGTERASEFFGYSQAVRTGPWILVSGQVGFDIERLNFPSEFEDQVRLAFKNLETVLKAAGAELKDVVEITTYQLDMKQFNVVVDVRNEVFGEHRPAWTPVGVTALALPSLQFTVKAVAYAPQRPQGAAASTPAAAPAPPAAAPAAPAAPASPPRGTHRPGY